MNQHPTHKWLLSAVVWIFIFVLQWSQNLPCWKASGLCRWFTNQAAILLLHQNYWPWAKRGWKQGKYEKKHYVKPRGFLWKLFRGSKRSGTNTEVLMVHTQPTDLKMWSTPPVYTCVQKKWQSADICRHSSIYSPLMWPEHCQLSIN